MGFISYIDPGDELTHDEYESNLTRIYDEFNGLIDNSNIKPTAGIVDTKLATISTAGKIADTALPVTMIGKTFSSLVTIQSGGLTVDAGPIIATLDGIDINGGGLTVMGGITVEDTGLTIAGGGFLLTLGNLIVASGNAVIINTTDGIDYTPVSDMNVDLMTVTVGGTPMFYWHEGNHHFASTVGMQIDSGGLTVATGGIDVNAGGLTVINGTTSIEDGLTVVSGGQIITAGGLTINGGFFTMNGSGVLIASGGLDITGGVLSLSNGITGGLTVNDVGLTITDGGIEVINGGIGLTVGGFNALSGNTINIRGTDGIDYNTGASVDEACYIATVDLSGSNFSEIKWNPGESAFTFSHKLWCLNGGLRLDGGNIALSGTVDGVDIAAHDAAITSVHGIVPIFSVYRSTNQGIGVGSTDKVQWSTENFDTNNNFDIATNYRFTPTEEGYYHFNLSISWVSPPTLDSYFIYIYKNGAVEQYSKVYLSAGIGELLMHVSQILYANGVSDYFEAFVSHTDVIAVFIKGLNTTTNFSGFRIPLS